MNSAVRLLDEAARKFPSRIAVLDEWEELSYAELRRRSLALGSELIRLSDEPDALSPVIVYLAKSARCVVSFLGTLYSGNPYVPVASDIPLSRLEKIIENLRPAFLITDSSKADALRSISLHGAKPLLYDELIAAAPDETLVSRCVERVTDVDPIYIMYTSGSTGVPKGVTVSHRGVIDYAQWVQKTFSIREDDIFANQAPFYFDNSILDIYGCLISGAKMVIIPEVLFHFQNKLPDFLKEQRVTTIFWVPTVMINVANSGALDGVELPCLRRVLFCGEVMPNTQLNIWRRALPDCLYANLYGPTEITDVCSYYIVDRAFSDHEPLPIGKACENMRIVILCDGDREAAPGEKGELCVLGTGVSLGYWNNPEQTQKAFVQNPLNKSYHERMYRTGDIAYRSEEGLLMYAGRMDHQIKIKGNRVELGEIETAAMCIDGVCNACAVFDEAHEKIVLFLESEQEMKLRPVNRALLQYIPSYMLPGQLVTMPHLPHTANDKIDRVALKKSLSEA